MRIWTHWAAEGYVPSGAEEKWGEVIWDFRGQEGSSHGGGKQMLLSVCWAIWNRETARASSLIITQEFL